MAAAPPAPSAARPEQTAQPQPAQLQAHPKAPQAQPQPQQPQLASSSAPDGDRWLQAREAIQWKADGLASDAAGLLANSINRAGEIRP